AHTRQSYPRTSARMAHDIQQFFRHATSVIPDFKNCGFRFSAKANVDLRSSRVAMCVRQTLLKHTEESDLNCMRQSLILGSKAHPHLDSAAPGETLEVPLRGG